MSRILLCIIAILTVATTVKAQTQITVAKDGSGDYATIQEAVDAAPLDGRTTIRIKAGTYSEQVTIGSKQKPSAKRLSLVGEGMGRTVITSDKGMKSHGVPFHKTPALSVYASDFYAEGLTIQNTAWKEGGQALALFVAGDRQAYYRCCIKGFQDTHRSNKNTRSYYKECTIEGGTDFIYAGGTCWFEKCRLNCIRYGYITAPEDINAYAEGEQKRIYLGFIFNDCTITAADSVADGSVYLGRCWGPRQCGAIFLNCKMTKAVNAEGWTVMGTNDGRESYYGEYRSTTVDGKRIDTSRRAAWSHQMSDADYEKVRTWNRVDEAFRASVRTATVFNPEEMIAECSREAKFTNDYAPTEPRLLAFPTARGFGKTASGGRGGNVVEVTNLDDQGEGSLRWALTEAGRENATIVFRVSGVITLKKDIRAKLRNVTIAGQTAPGMGILYRGAKLNLGGSRNVIIRNIRGRLGKTDDGRFIGGGSIGIENADTIIIDHCCFGWSGEENMTIYDNHFTTVQWTIVHEGLYNAGHPKGARGYGSQWGGSPSSYHHNLLAHNVSRSPRINGASNVNQDRNVLMEYYNNVNYNWGGAGSCYGGENEAGELSSHDCNFVGNYYKPGPGAPSGSYFISISNNRARKTSAGPSHWFFAGNRMDGNAMVSASNWLAVHNNTEYPVAALRCDTMITTQKRFWPEQNRYDYSLLMTPTESADDAYLHVLEKAGTVNRDLVEQRIVDEVRSRTARYSGASNRGKGFIDSHADAEGYTDYPTAKAVDDNDHDGMDDEWELRHGLNPNDPNDRNHIVSAEGYTALEAYLCSLMGERINLR